MRLGKLAPRFDHRTLRLGDYLRRDALPPIPASTGYRRQVRAWPMMKNDALGDCAIAGPGHEIQCWTTNDHAPYVPPDADIVKAYSAVSGYDPKTGRNDDGCVMLDVLNYWRKTGISGRKISAFAALELKDHAHVMDSVYLFDGCLLGLSLPLAVQGMRTWPKPKSHVGVWQAGSWGGHCVPIVDYDAQWCYVVSWGRIIPMAWEFYDAYCDESYVVFSPDWFGADAKAPNGFNWKDLAADLASITGLKPPRRRK
jgi:hypothetical protein